MSTLETRTSASASNQPSGASRPQGQQGAGDPEHQQFHWARLMAFLLVAVGVCVAAYLYVG